MTDPVRLLIVEESAVVQMDLADVLRGAGFDLLATRNGAEALAELEADATRFRALVTSVGLRHEPDGWEIARRARELSPSMPVVYISGTNPDEWSSHGVPDSILVEKPFAPVQIVTAVSMLLNKVGSP